MYCAAGHFQEVGYLREPAVTTRDVESNFLTGLRPNDANRKMHGLPVDQGKGGRGEHGWVPRGVNQEKNKPGILGEGIEKKPPRNESLQSEPTRKNMEAMRGEPGRGS